MFQHALPCHKSSGMAMDITVDGVRAQFGPAASPAKQTEH